jgi:hypothetical protein
MMDNQSRSVRSCKREIYSYFKETHKLWVASKSLTDLCVEELMKLEQVNQALLCTCNVGSNDQLNFFQTPS